VRRPPPRAEALADGAIDALMMLAAALARRHCGPEAESLLVAPLRGAARWPDEPR
jgi:hypothetical protein